MEMKGVTIVFKKVKARHGATHLLFSIVRITLGVMLVKTLLIASFFWLMHRELEAENVAGPAPAGDYRIRRQWGEENLEVYLTSAEKWIMRSAKIENDIGKVSVSYTHLTLPTICSV